MSDLGDRAVGSILYFNFSTLINGAPALLTNSPVVNVFKGNNLTPESTNPTLTANLTNGTNYAANGSFTTSSGSIVMNAAPPVWVLPGATVYDATTASTVGTVKSISGTTVTLNANSLINSSGSTDNINFGMVGYHQVKVDTTVDTTFYAAGNDYTVVLVAGNLGVSTGPSVADFTIGHFSLGLGNVSNIDNAAGPTNAIARGTVTTGGSTTSVPTSALAFNGVAASGVVANQLVNRVIMFDGNTTTAGLRGAVASIASHTASNTPTFTVGTLPVTPASGDTFSIV